MDRNKFIQASTRIRVFEKNLLTKSQINRLLDSESLQTALTSLNDSSYSADIKNLQRDEDFEKILSQGLLNSFDEIKKISPDKNLLRFLEEEYNFHNLKVMLKEILQDKNYSSIYVDIGEADILAIKKAIKNDEKLSDNPYYSYALKAYNLYKESKNPQVIDLYLDKCYYDKLLKDAKDLDDESLLNFTKEKIDLINLKSLIRVKSQQNSLDSLQKALIAGGTIEKENFEKAYAMEKSTYPSLLTRSKAYKYAKKAFEADDLRIISQNLEKAIDNHMMDFAKNAKKITFGPEVILGFLISKQMEIKNLRIILVGKLNSLSREFIEKRLRETYV